MSEGSGKKIKWLESMRGIACLIVVFAHIISSDSVIGVYASGCGKIGVWLFMILSGYFSILPYLGTEWNSLNFSLIIRYYIKKFLRIYPAYILAIVLAWICGFIGVDSIFRHIFILEAWGHFWFMPVIIKFYLVMPIFLCIYQCTNKFLVKYIDTKGCHYVFAFIITCVAAIFCIIYPYTSYTENSIALKWYIPVFIIGMLLAVIMEHVKVSKIYFDVLAFLFFVMILIPTPFFRKLIWNVEPGGYLQNKYIYMGLVWGFMLFSIAKSRYLDNV